MQRSTSVTTMYKTSFLQWRYILMQCRDWWDTRNMHIRIKHDSSSQSFWNIFWSVHLKCTHSSGCTIASMWKVNALFRHVLIIPHRSWLSARESICGTFYMNDQFQFSCWRQSVMQFDINAVSRNLFRVICLPARLFTHTLLYSYT